MSFSHKIRVGVLRGGPSPEYEVSLNTGRTILSNLPEEFEPLDIFVSKDGAWHVSGFEKEPHKILKSVDLVINAMHGAYGEDGTVQKLLEHFGVPYTGSGSLSSALGMNKVMSKNIFNQAGLKTPNHVVVEKEGDIGKAIVKINESLIFPIIIKPVNSGSSLGVCLVESPGMTKDALRKSFEHSPRLMAEEYISGKEITCGVIEDFRGQKYYTLLPVEISGNEKEIFHSYDSKYSPDYAASRYKIPGSFKEDDKVKIQEAAALIHRVLGLRHYSRSDFILHPKRGLFVLEVNTLPELTHRSSFIKSLEAVGGNIKEFLSHIASKALAKK